MYAQKYVYIPITIFVDSLLKVMLISVLKSFYVLQSIDVAEYNIFMSYGCPVCLFCNEALRYRFTATQALGKSKPLVETQVVNPKPKSI